MEPRDWIGKRVRFKNPPQLDMGVVVDVHDGDARMRSFNGGPVIAVTTQTDDGRIHRAMYADVLEVIDDPRDGAAG